jgi:large subunit ribosomal protein L32
MAVPKRRKSRRRRNERRAHDALVPLQTVKCPSCGEPTQRHRACPKCGQYRGRQVVAAVEE